MTPGLRTEPEFLEHATLVYAWRAGLESGDLRAPHHHSQQVRLGIGPLGEGLIICKLQCSAVQAAKNTWSRSLGMKTTPSIFSDTRHPMGCQELWESGSHNLKPYGVIVILWP